LQSFVLRLSQRPWISTATPALTLSRSASDFKTDRAEEIKSDFVKPKEISLRGALLRPPVPFAEHSSYKGLLLSYSSSGAGIGIALPKHLAP
jgi:hypothetical protein